MKCVKFNACFLLDKFYLILTYITVVSPAHRPPLPPENIPGTHSCYRRKRKYSERNQSLPHILHHKSQVLLLRIEPGPTKKISTLVYIQIQLVLHKEHRVLPLAKKSVNIIIEKTAAYCKHKYAVRRICGVYEVLRLTVHILTTGL